MGNAVFNIPAFSISSRLVLLKINLQGNVKTSKMSVVSLACLEANHQVFQTFQEMNDRGTSVSKASRVS